MESKQLKRQGEKLERVWAEFKANSAGGQTGRADQRSRKQTFSPGCEASPAPLQLRTSKTQLCTSCDSPAQSKAAGGSPPWKKALQFRLPTAVLKKADQ